MTAREFLAYSCVHYDKLLFSVCERLRRPSMKGW
jgi:hypothetical protein